MPTSTHVRRQRQVGSHVTWADSHTIKYCQLIFLPLLLLRINRDKKTEMKKVYSNTK